MEPAAVRIPPPRVLAVVEVEIMYPVLMWFSAVNISPLVMPFMLRRVPGVVVPIPTLPPSLTTKEVALPSSRVSRLPVPF